MSASVFELHEQTPQKRLLQQIAASLRSGGLAVLPSDGSYLLAWLPASRDALTKARWIRRLGDQHQMSLLCADFSGISDVARVSDTAFRLMKRLTPGPYTFILEATKSVPKYLHQPKRKSIGIRVPNHPVLQGLLQEVGPLCCTTLKLPDEEWPLSSPEEITESMHNQVDVIALCGWGGTMVTTVIDCIEGEHVIREGLGFPF